MKRVLSPTSPRKGPATPFERYIRTLAKKVSNFLCKVWMNLS
jgi:hypothetical protein